MCGFARTEPAIRNIADQVNDTLRNLRKTGSPNVTVKHVKTLTTQDASKAEIYYFTGDKFGNFEATAYIQARGSIHFITLSARDQDVVPASDSGLRRSGDILRGLDKTADATAKTSQRRVKKPMITWDSELYLRYELERTQPSIDLATRIPLEAPKEIIDLGCGPGNSTRVFRQRWPNARIVGLDSSSADDRTGSSKVQQILSGESQTFKPGRSPSGST